MRQLADGRLIDRRHSGARRERPGARPVAAGADRAGRDRQRQRTAGRAAALADLGVGIAIDDFGTGYSNMTYLRRLPVSGLKLAGSFIDGLRSGRADHTDAKIVRSILSLAHDLGLTVTAEGVETAAQAHALRELGCDTAQGTVLRPPRTRRAAVHRVRPERVGRLAE